MAQIVTFLNGGDTICRLQKGMQTKRMRNIFNGPKHRPIFQDLFSMEK
jgi:hypothetical protein